MAKEKNKTKIIVELCQNHTGDRKILGEMVKTAAESGADIVKIQSIFAEDLSRRERFESGETDKDGKTLVIKRPFEAEQARLNPLDLSEADHKWFIKECEKRGVLALTTVFARRRVPFVASLPWPEKMIKIASYDCGSLPLIKDLIDSGFQHFIISTGASFDDEIINTSKLVKDSGRKLTLLHCVTSYPNTLEMANLKRMNWLRKLTPSVGWSDHTLVKRDGLLASKAAIYLGADYVERHFTVLPESATKDGPVSITPAMVAELVRFRNLSSDDQLKELKKENPDWEIVLGVETREMTHQELLNRDYYRGRFGQSVGGKWKFNWEE